jgi:hypothetical protein
MQKSHCGWTRISGIYTKYSERTVRRFRSFLLARTHSYNLVHHCGHSLGHTWFFYFSWMGYDISAKVNRIATMWYIYNDLNCYLVMSQMEQLLYSLGHFHLFYQIRTHLVVSSSLNRSSFSSGIHFSRLGISAYYSMGSTIEKLSLGCIYVARCRFGYCRWIQGTFLVKYFTVCIWSIF